MSTGEPAGRIDGQPEGRAVPAGVTGEGVPTPVNSKQSAAGVTGAAGLPDGTSGASAAPEESGADRTARPLPAARDGWAQLRRLRPALLVGAAALVAWSYFLPSWRITLLAPQYPQGLTVRIGGTGVTGDVSEVDELNHYIGMMRLGDLAGPERRLWPWGVGLLVVVLLLAALLRGRLGALLSLSALAYPVGFAADLYRWLYYAGHHLDPHAALSSSIHPFMPAFMGSRMVGQFQTTAAFGSGYGLALLAAVLGVTAAVVTWRGKPQ